MSKKTYRVDFTYTKADHYYVTSEQPVEEVLRDAIASAKDAVDADNKRMLGIANIEVTNVEEELGVDYLTDPYLADD